MRGWIWSLVLAATPVFADGGCAPGIGPIDSATPTTPEGPVLETPLRPAFDQPLPARVETATFGLGWFWGPDSRFGGLPGVLRTRVGYAGGTQPHPTYHRIGDHTETFQVDFDPEVISYADLLERVWRGHDPTAAAWSRQYRNVILVGSPAQREAAEASRDRWQAKLAKPITTQIEALRTFTRAEDYHQKYYLRGQARLASALVRAYPDADAFTDSSAAMRLNAYLGGHGDPAQLQRELPWLGLDGEAQELLLRAYTRRR